MKGYIFLNRHQNIQKLGSEICYKIGRGGNIELMSKVTQQ